MDDTVNRPARSSALSITDLMVEAMSDFGEKDFTRCVVIAMSDEGDRRYLYSNARSEPEMFGMIAMASADWATEADEEDGQ
jgi:hypothetical protein